jgi:D-alanyl-D-alanine dipeptidase
MRINALIACSLVVAAHRAGAAQINAPELPLASRAAAESLLVDVASLDSTIRIDARYATANNFTGSPLPGYDAPRALLRREAALALQRVQIRVRSGGFALKVFDGYRPVRATVAMVNWAERTGRLDLVENGYIARRSRHNLGIAVDLTLVDAASGMELNMGTPYDTFSEAAHTANATGLALKHRRILVHAMEAEGFANYDQEWWHFSYPVAGALPFDEPIGAR